MISKLIKSKPTESSPQEKETSTISTYSTPNPINSKRAPTDNSRDSKTSNKTTGWWSRNPVPRKGKLYWKPPSINSHKTTIRWSSWSSIMRRKINLLRKSINSLSKDKQKSRKGTTRLKPLIELSLKNCKKWNPCTLRLKTMSNHWKLKNHNLSVKTLNFHLNLAHWKPYMKKTSKD